MLVWKAMPSIVPTMSAMRLDEPLISSMVLTTCETTSPPRRATTEAEAASCLAWSAASALWRTLQASCSVELAVCCRLEAACSVRWLRSVLPEATSALASWIDSAAWRTGPTMPRSASRIAASD